MYQKKVWIPIGIAIALLVMAMGLASVPTASTRFMLVVVPGAILFTAWVCLSVIHWQPRIEPGIDRSIAAPGEGSMRLRVTLSGPPKAMPESAREEHAKRIAILEHLAGLVLTGYIDARTGEVSELPTDLQTALAVLKFERARVAELQAMLEQKEEYIAAQQQVIDLRQQAREAESRLRNQTPKQQREEKRKEPKEVVVQEKASKEPDPARFPRADSPIVTGVCDLCGVGGDNWVLKTYNGYVRAAGEPPQTVKVCCGPGSKPSLCEEDVRRQRARRRAETETATKPAATHEVAS